MKMNTGAKARRNLIRLGILTLLAAGLLQANFFTPPAVLAQEPVSNADTCIACHTDEEKMQTLTKEEEIVSEESSGEG
ncbi:MAG TPA: hypothetical protein G4N96_12840 [Chloroflexi bacterium]|nr:hypothetical protein [Chloroflexota bacterium]